MSIMFGSYSHEGGAEESKQSIINRIKQEERAEEYQKSLMIWPCIQALGVHPQAVGDLFVFALRIGDEVVEGAGKTLQEAAESFYEAVCKQKIKEEDDEYDQSFEEEEGAFEGGNFKPMAYKGISYGL